MTEVCRSEQEPSFTMKLKDGTCFSVLGGVVKISAPPILISAELDAVERRVDHF